MPMIYLDANATVPVTDPVRKAVIDAMDGHLANPSSMHLAGADARRALEEARSAVRLFLPEIWEEGIVFTSGGTEANNMVLRGITDATIVTTAVEHPSVLRPARASGRAVVLPVSAEGIVSPEAVADALPPDGRAPILSVQWANSETGVIQPVAEIVRLAREARPDAFIHVDAAQAIGRIDLDVGGIDAVTFSGHKLHAPGGTGVLALLDPEDERITPLLLGGGQERGYRSGTQNVLGIVGLGAALLDREWDFRKHSKAMRDMRDAFERAVLRGVPGSVVNGGGALRVPNTSNIRFPGADAMALVAALDQRDVACSVGSACSSGRPEPSHVLTAMGLSEAEAYSSVRFSFSVLNTIEEAHRAAEIVIDTVRGKA